MSFHWHDQITIASEVKTSKTAENMMVIPPTKESKCSLITHESFPVVSPRVGEWKKKIKGNTASKFSSIEYKSHLLDETDDLFPDKVEIDIQKEGYGYGMSSSFSTSSEKFPPSTPHIQSTVISNAKSSFSPISSLQRKKDLSPGLVSWVDSEIKQVRMQYGSIRDETHRSTIESIRYENQMINPLIEKKGGVVVSKIDTSPIVTEEKKASPKLDSMKYHGVIISPLNIKSIPKKRAPVVQPPQMDVSFDTTSRLPPSTFVRVSEPARPGLGSPFASNKASPTVTVHLGRRNPSKYMHLSSSSLASSLRSATVNHGIDLSSKEPKIPKLYKNLVPTEKEREIDEGRRKRAPIQNLPHHEHTPKVLERRLKRETEEYIKQREVKNAGIVQPMGHKVRPFPRRFCLTVEENPDSISTLDDNASPHIREGAIPMKSLFGRSKNAAKNAGIVVEHCLLHTRSQYEGLEITSTPQITRTGVPSLSHMPESALLDEDDLDEAVTPTVMKGIDISTFDDTFIHSVGQLKIEKAEKSGGSGRHEDYSLDSYRHSHTSGAHSDDRRVHIEMQGGTPRTMTIISPRVQNISAGCGGDGRSEEEPVKKSQLASGQDLSSLSSNRRECAQEEFPSLPATPKTSNIGTFGMPENEDVPLEEEESFDKFPSTPMSSYPIAPSRGFRRSLRTTPMSRLYEALGGKKGAKPGESLEREVCSEKGLDIVGKRIDGCMEIVTRRKLIKFPDGKEQWVEVEEARLVKELVEAEKRNLASSGADTLLKW
ncbi:hypothetical protein ADUPG1_000596 [Aduncisulcus paluster]|uniref:Uncharacterized protein n=1 Tax=Aduncisulcus paluster TaxID=2918883 RepID=A0ABQ5K745_9EUKA|nr:hypothetical protein ADUPG1_000596 [Aduncisulcus paluster]